MTRPSSALTPLVCAAALSLSACDVSPSSSGAGGAGGEPDAGGGGIGGSTMPEYEGSVAGTVVDEAGNPVAALGVSLCFTVCRVVETDASGAFVFEGIEPATQVIENIGWPDDPVSSVLVHTKFFDFVTLGVDEQVTIDRPFVLRSVDTDGPISGMQQLTLDGGLEVSFDADRFGTMTDPLPSPAMEAYFGAVEIPEADWPAHGYDGWRILRAWGLAVWDLHAEDGFTVTAPLGAAGPLPADSDVAFLVADYTYGFQNGVFFEEEAELSSDGTRISTPASGGLDRSTMWLAVVRP